jgi:hypothetical protein
MATIKNSIKNKPLNSFQWCRPLPVASSAISSSAASIDGKYIYYANGSSFYKYSIEQNSWQQIASLPAASSNFIAMSATKSLGYTYYAVSAGPSNNTIELGNISEKILVGKKIKIIAGKGAGQERTITSISDPVVYDMGKTTVAAVNNAIYNSASEYNAAKKRWVNGELTGRQLKINYGTGANSIIRQISYNMRDAAYTYKPTNRRTKGLFGNFTANTSVTQPNWTQYVIDSSIATVDSNWNITPDSTSLISVESDGVLLFTSSSTSPFYTMYYYSSLVDAWFTQEIRFNMFLSASGTDMCLTNVEDNNENILFSANVTNATNRSLTSSSLNLTPNSYNNYEVEITSGTGIGQKRLIIGNNAQTIFISRQWDTNPNNTSVYKILQKESTYITGNGASSIYQYNFDDNFSTNQMLDFGNAADISAEVVGRGIWGVNSIVLYPNSIETINTTPIAPGSGYYVGQVIRLTNGTENAHVIVNNVDQNGGVTQVTLIDPGRGYAIGTEGTSNPEPSGGTGCTIEILSRKQMVLVTTNTDNTFKVGEFVKINGATQSVYNDTFEIKYRQYTGGSTTFYIDVPSAVANGTATATHSATQLVDSTKNWTTNEHVGKIINIKNIATGFSRIITANTANTLTFATVATAPSNTTTQYEIVDPKAFGTEKSYGAIIGNGNFGVATGGSTTTLIDSTKNWPINWWSTVAPAATGTGRKVRIIAGTGAGTEMTILSNTATTLTFTSQSFSVDSTSIYQILDNFGVATAGTTTTLTDTTQNWAINSLANRRVRLLAGTGMGLEYPIISNTQTQITFATATAPDTTTAYSILNIPSRGAGIEMFKIKNSSISSYNKYIYLFRGGATPEIGRYNLVDMSYEPIQTTPILETLSTGSMYAYDGVDTIYFTKESTGRIMSYNIISNEILPIGIVPYGMSTAIIGNRMSVHTMNNLDKYLFIMRHNGQEMWRLKLN